MKERRRIKARPNSKLKMQVSTSMDTVLLLIDPSEAVKLNACWSKSDASLGKDSVTKFKASIVRWVAALHVQPT